MTEQNLQMEQNQNNNQSKENKMGTMAINPLLLSMALPMMLSMLVQALYNIVDSLFLAKLGEYALTALSLAFPIQMLLIAFGNGLGVGVNALLSKSLGEKRHDRANSAAIHGIVLSIVGVVIFMIFGIFFARPFFASQINVNEVVDGALIVQGGTSYLSIVCIVSAGAFGQMIFERLLQSTGRTMLSMITQMTGAVINIILDPILIFGLLGAPKLGIAGAAIATVIGQCVAASLALLFNIKFNHEIRLSLKGFKLDMSVLKKIMSVGIPAMAMQAVGSLMSFLMNLILLTFSATAATVFGIYFKINSFIFMPVFGLTNGIIPIISYNFGARNKDRMLKALKLAIIYAVVIMTVGCIIFQVMPGLLLGLFEASENMLAIGVPALRIISTSFIFAAICIVLGSCFQALGNGHYSLVVSFCRQIIVLVPVAYLFAKTGNLNLVWLCYPISEMMSIVLSLFFFKRLYDKNMKPLGK